MNMFKYFIKIKTQQIPTPYVSNLSLAFVLLFSCFGMCLLSVLHIFYVCVNIVEYSIRSKTPNNPCATCVKLHFHVYFVFVFLRFLRFTDLILGVGGGGGRGFNNDVLPRTTPQLHRSESLESQREILRIRDLRAQEFARNQSLAVSWSPGGSS